MHYSGIETESNWGYVYFVQAETGGPIKIGSASKVLSRLRELQTGNPEKLQVLHSTTGGKKLEYYLHDKFAQHRKLGEWFYDVEEVYDLIDKFKGEDELFGKPLCLCEFVKINYLDTSEDELDDLIAISNSYFLNNDVDSIEKRIRYWNIIDEYLEYQKRFPAKVIRGRLFNLTFYEGRGDFERAIRRERNIKLKNF